MRIRRVLALALTAGGALKWLRDTLFTGDERDYGFMTALAERAARKLLGDDRVHLIQRPTMTTEDFGLFLQERPGSFYHIGAGCPLPLHNAAFLPDARAAVTAAAVHAAVIAAYLTGETGA